MLLQTDSRIDITVIVALITTLAAIIAPLITAIINHVSAYRLKTLELFFVEKVKAYHEYMDIASCFPINPTPDDMHKLFSTLNKAALYSSKDTVQQLNCYAYFLLDTDHSDKNAIAEANFATLQALQRELKKYKKHY